MYVCMCLFWHSFLLCVAFCGCLGHRVAAEMFVIPKPLLSDLGSGFP